MRRRPTSARTFVLPLALAAAILAGAILAGAPARAAAQTVRLQDADVARLLPVLAAATQERERRHDAVAGMLADQRDAEGFHADVQAGRVDLEAVLRRHAPSAAPPPGAAFDDACSRSQVLPGSSGGVRGSFMTVYTLAPGADLARVEAFYVERGFRVTSRGRGVTSLEPARGASDSLRVSIGPLFRHDGPLGCRHLDGRPLVTLGLPRFDFVAHDEAAAPAVRAAESGRARALATVGLTEAAFDALLGAAMTAVGDATDDAMTGQLRTMAERIPDLRAMAEARLHNAAWYRRHQARLEPTLGRFLEGVGR